MDNTDLNRRIIAGNIDRHPVGSKLTAAAREKAIDFGVAAFTGQTNNGTAAELGIKHATSEVLK